MIEDSRLIRNAANDRLRAAFGQTAASTAPVVAYASSGAPVAVALNHAGPAFWAQGFGSWGAFDGDDGGKTLDRDTSGVLLGGDALLNLWRVGVTGGYSQSNIKPRDRASSVSSDSYHLGVYAGTQHGALAFRTGLAQSWHDLDARRTIAIPSLSDRTRVEYRADALQAFGEVAYGLTASNGARLEPFVNLAHIRLKTDAFSESGGDAALTGEKANADATFATLGLRAEQAFALGETKAALRGTVGWRRAFGDTSPQSVHAFTAGDAFTITGAPISKDSAVLEGGLALSFTPATTMSLGYTGQISTGAQDHAFTASFSLKF
jgi:outer membrane autotransporter protein